MNSLQFLEAGYKQHRADNMHRADFLLQKRIYDVIGTKYYLNIYCYVNKELEETFQAEVQFYQQSKPLNACFWLFESVEEVEVIFEEMWERMRFDYLEQKQCND